ncbi:MAG: suppressor of fused domain protein [Candidatus Obscuribacterales bacterium]|nr:suppressor of fused domain protein [Candidatus Obscuribacterales bacterium]
MVKDLCGSHSVLIAEIFEKMRQISELRRAVGKHVMSAFSIAKPSVREFWDDKRTSVVDILMMTDNPQSGVNSYATIGLSESPMLRDGKEFPTRLELVGACGSAFRDMDKVLATAAFCVINSDWFCAPGIIFPDVMDMYGLSTTMSDIYFSQPFLWEDKLHSTTIEGKTVAWLLAVPVSKRETEFAREHGSNELEKLFERQDIDIFDYNRVSVV